jgi:UDP:flavonoid glycosyltransferase YjiC (YdhE family)
MNVVFFMIPYQGHIRPEAELLRSFWKKGDRFLLFGVPEHLRPLFHGPEGPGEICFGELPEAVRRSFDRTGIAGSGRMIQREALTGTFLRGCFARLLREAEEFAQLCGETVRNFRPDRVFADSYAYYCDRAIQMTGLPCVEINAAMYEPAERNRSRIWNTYIRDLFRDGPEEPDPDRIAADCRRYSAWYERAMGPVPKEEQADFSIPEFYTEDCGPIRHLGFPMEPSGDQNPSGRQEEIYLTRGTMAGPEGVSVLKEMILGLSGCGRVTVSCGGQKEVLEELRTAGLPACADLRLFCDQKQMLQRADVFLTHGGITGVREAIASLTPMIVVPSNFQDYLTGTAVGRLGAGIFLRDGRRDPRAVRDAVRAIRRAPDRYERSLRIVRSRFAELWDQNGAYCPVPKES